MTDAETARTTAAGLRAQADQTDHVDEEDGLRDLAQLLERLADAVPTPQSVEDRLDGLFNLGRMASDVLADAMDSPDRDVQTRLYRQAETMTASAQAAGAIETARATHRLAAAVEALAQREQVTHVTINEVPAAAPVPPVTTDTEPSSTNGFHLGGAVGLGRPSSRDAEPPLGTEPVSAEDALARRAASTRTAKVTGALDAAAEHPEAVEARLAAEQRLAAAHEHDVREEIAKTTPSAGATPDVIDAPATSSAAAVANQVPASAQITEPADMTPQQKAAATRKKRLQA